MNQEKGEPKKLLEHIAGQKMKKEKKKKHRKNTVERI